jgi:hypothetical protein
VAGHNFESKSGSIQYLIDVYQSVIVGGIDSIVILIVAFVNSALSLFVLFTLLPQICIVVVVLDPLMVNHFRDGVAGSSLETRW